MSVVIIQNVTHEKPGLIGEVLTDLGVSFKTVDLSRGDFLPDPSGYRAVIVLGGPQSANDDTLHMNRLTSFVRALSSRHIPYLGICLGMQILAKVGGGSIVPAESPEIGWTDSSGRNFSFTAIRAGSDDPLFDGIDFPLELFHLHRETAVLSDKTRLLALGNRCAVQVIKVGTSAYGIQGHLEITRSMLEQWMPIDKELMKMDNDSLIHQFDKIENKLTRTGKKLFENFLRSTGVV